MTLDRRRTDHALVAAPLDPDATALFLDMDGTLVELADRPQDVQAEPALTELLRRLASRLDGRIAVLSGRTIAEVDRVLEGAVTAVAGVHGLERRTAAGALLTPPPPAGLKDAEQALQAFVEQRRGALLENKGLGLGLHYRQAPEHGPEATALARRLAAEHGLTLQLGSMVAELRAPGGGKGEALAAFMQEAPFSGRRPVFVGDDLTDEHGFEAAAALGGHGVLVGAERSTAATSRLEGVDAVRSWLAAAVS